MELIGAVPGYLKVYLAGPDRSISGGDGEKCAPVLVHGHVLLLRRPRTEVSVVLLVSSLSGILTGFRLALRVLLQRQREQFGNVLSWLENEWGICLATTDGLLKVGPGSGRSSACRPAH